MEKVGQIYKAKDINNNYLYFKIKQIENSLITYYYKKENEKDFVLSLSRAFIGSFENCELIVNVEEEIIIPVSRLSKIE